MLHLRFKRRCKSEVKNEWWSFVPPVSWMTLSDCSVLVFPPFVEHLLWWCSNNILRKRKKKDGAAVRLKHNPLYLCVCDSVLERRQNTLDQRNVFQIICTVLFTIPRYKNGGGSVSSVLIAWPLLAFTHGGLRCMALVRPCHLDAIRLSRLNLSCLVWSNVS